MPKINVYLPDDLAEAVREANIPVSAVCQRALQHAVRRMAAVNETARHPGRRRSGDFTPRLARALKLAAADADRRGQPFLGTEHVLLGLLDEAENVAIQVLRAMEVDLVELREAVEQEMGRRGDRRRLRREISMTPRARRAIRLAAREAARMGHSYVGCEHVLIGLVIETEGVAGCILRSMGVEPVSTRRAVLTALRGYADPPEDVVTEDVGDEDDGDDEAGTDGTGAGDLEMTAADDRAVRVDAKLDEVLARVAALEALLADLAGRGGPAATAPPGATEQL